MKSVAERKQELLLACGIQREMVQLEWQVLRLQVNRWQGSWRSLSQAWPLAAPILGYLMLRRRARRAVPVAAKPVKLLLLYKAWQWWRLLRRKPS